MPFLNKKTDSYQTPVKSVQAPAELDNALHLIRDIWGKALTQLR
jgi:hypothetical protein